MLGARGATVEQLKKELESVDTMLRLAQSNATKPDTKVTRLVEWIQANMLLGRDWNTRRAIIFTEWEDTRLWLEKQLREALDDTDRVDERIGVYTGMTSQDRREDIKRQFNADPDEEPLRILICTNAAREGINLQTRCHDLFHFDLPWNPSRLEQRNGRIDRKLQPAPKVYCRYFDYTQRPEDIVLRALVDKTETIRQELGAIGQVIEARIT
jgi:SNF2 family DNA or RNA helicase